VRYQAEISAGDALKRGDGFFIGGCLEETQTGAPTSLPNNSGFSAK
jgi:hypothetical protein